MHAQHKDILEAADYLDKITLLMSANWLRELAAIKAQQPSGAQAGLVDRAKELIAFRRHSIGIDWSEDAKDVMRQFITEYDASPLPGDGGASLQDRVDAWMQKCFGKTISADTQERNHRFFEEATELVQACGMTASEAHQLVDYTYNRPLGDGVQEVGGVMVTLAALCTAQGFDMSNAAETELARITTPACIEKIRAKQAAKPKHSPLPASEPDKACPSCGRHYGKHGAQCLDNTYQQPVAAQVTRKVIDLACDAYSDWFYGGSSPDTVRVDQSNCHAMRAALEAVAPMLAQGNEGKDAERYRYLRSEDGYLIVYFGQDAISSETLDEAIDAAIAAQKDQTP